MIAIESVGSCHLWSLAAMTRADDISEMRKDPPAASALERIASALEKLAGAQRETLRLQRRRRLCLHRRERRAHPGSPRQPGRYRAAARDRPRSGHASCQHRCALRKASRPTMRCSGARAAWANRRSSRASHGAINRQFAGSPSFKAPQTYRNPPRGHRGASPPDGSVAGSHPGGSSFFATIFPSMARIPATNR